jgi:hypothetical protein
MFVAVLARSRSGPLTRPAATDNDVGQWQWQKLLEVFGAHPGESASYRATTNAELNDILSRPEVVKAEKLTLIEARRSQTTADSAERRTGHARQVRRAARPYRPGPDDRKGQRRVDVGSMWQCSTLSRLHRRCPPPRLLGQHLALCGNLDLQAADAGLEAEVELKVRGLEELGDVRLGGVERLGPLTLSRQRKGRSPGAWRPVERARCWRCCWRTSGWHSGRMP